MDISLGVIFGIIAMVGWGTADFFVAKAVKRTSTLKAFVWSQLISAILFLIIFLMFFNFKPFSLSTFWLILITGFFGVISYLAFMKGLQEGMVSIVSPISACWALVTIILSLVFLNEQLTLVKSIGVAFAIMGTILTSFKWHDLSKMNLNNVSKGAGYAVLAALTWGIYFFFIAILVSRMGWFVPILLVKVFSVLFVLGYSGLTKKDIAFPKDVTLFIVLMGVLEVVAFLGYGVGVSFEYTAVVAPIGAAYPMITIILARLFFKETLEMNQKIGVVSILAGLVLLSI